LVGIKSVSCMNPPENDAPGMHLPSSCTKNTHTAVQLVVVVVVSSFIVWLVGIESACIRRGCTTPQ
jgi:hypothetical protein